MSPHCVALPPPQRDDSFFFLFRIALFFEELFCIVSELLEGFFCRSLVMNRSQPNQIDNCCRDLEFFFLLLE